MPCNAQAFKARAIERKHTTLIFSRDGKRRQFKLSEKRYENADNLQVSLSIQGTLLEIPASYLLKCKDPARLHSVTVTLWLLKILVNPCLATPVMWMVRRLSKSSRLNLPGSAGKGKSAVGLRTRFSCSSRRFFILGKGLILGSSDATLKLNCCNVWSTCSRFIV